MNGQTMANILPKDKQIAAIAALAEGNSIRSIERMTGVHRDTIMRLGVRVGQGYAWGFQDDAGHWQYVAVLKVPPVDTPQDAVRAYIISRQQRSAPSHHLRRI